MKFVATRAIVGMLLGGFLGACAPKPVPVPASPDFAQAALAMERPGPDKARIYVFTGRSYVGNQFFTTRRAHGMPADIFVDDTKIGTVSPREALVFDVRPGKYSFSWMIYNQKRGFLETMKPAEVNATGGETLLLSAELEGFSFEFSTGVLTSLVDADRKRLLSDVKVTRPASCPSSICI
jgi:hypothetical protein